MNIYKAKVADGIVSAGQKVWIWRNTKEMPALVCKIFLYADFLFSKGKIIPTGMGVCRYEDSPTVFPDELGKLFLSEEKALLNDPNLVRKRKHPLFRAGGRQVLAAS